MYRRAIRSLFVATTVLLLSTASACDKAEEKKTADKAAEKKTDDKAPETPKEQPPVEPPPVEPPPVEPPADSGAVAADAGTDAGAPAEGGEPAADGGGEKADGGGTKTDGGGEKKSDPKPEPKPDDKAGESTVAKADGKAIFESKCKSCHGADGKGDTTIGKKVNIPSLSGTKLSKSKIVSITEGGVPDTKMKGFKDRLTGDEIDAVAAYVLKL